MQGFDSIHVWCILRACGRRNPLVRNSDRIELLIVALGVLVALVATACAGALGTAVYDARSSVYLAEAQTRHTVIATAIEESTTALGVRDNVVEGSGHEPHDCPHSGVCDPPARRPGGQA